LIAPRMRPNISEEALLHQFNMPSYVPEGLPFPIRGAAIV
jgi:hypothetical protein